MAEKDKDFALEFPPGFSVRMFDKARYLPEEEIRQKGKIGDMLKTAAQDMHKQPAMKKGNFVICTAKADVCDHDRYLWGMRKLHRSLPGGRH